MTRVTRALVVAGPPVLLAAALLLPLGWVAAHGWTLTGVYEESIGYRYFYSLRVVYGGEYAFLPQGHLVDIVYQWLQRLLTASGYPTDQLFPRIDVFAYAAVVMPHLTAVACFAWAVAPVSALAGRLFAVPFWLAAYYGLGLVQSGTYVLLQPDYHPWILPIGLLTAGIFFRGALSSQWSINHTAALGVFMGAAAAVKVTLVIFPGSIALACILAKRPWRRSLALVGLSVAVGVVTWLAILFVGSQGRIDRLVQLLRDLITFTESTRPTEAYAGWASTVATEAPLIVKLSVALPFLLLVGAVLARTRTELGAIAGLAVGAALYHAFLYWRFVPATWFEAAVFLQFAVWSAARMLVRGRFPAGSAWSGALVMTLALLVSGGPALAHNWRNIERNDHGSQELLHLLSGQGDVAFLIPENFFRPFTVDAAIAKGMNNILDERASALIRRMVPDRRYLLGAPRYSPAYYRRHPVDVSEFTALVFVVPLKEGWSKSDQIRELETYYSVTLAGFACTRDVDLSESGQNVAVCLRREGILEDREATAVLHVPAGTKLNVGQLVRDGLGGPARLREGDVVLSGRSGQLMRIEKGGTLVRLAAEDRRQIRVTNIGQWDIGRRAYLGLPARYVDKRWRVDSAAVRPANANAGFDEGGGSTPILGFWISPDGAGHTISRLRDEDGMFVRVRATRDGPYLVINGGRPLSALDSVPVTVRGQIRARSRGKMALTLYDVIDHERAESSSAQTEAVGEWQTLLVQREKVTYPAPGDNFSIGLIGPKAGDWFDVRELSLFVGTLP